MDRATSLYDENDRFKRTLFGDPHISRSGQWIYLDRCHRRRCLPGWPVWRWSPLLYTIESMRAAAIGPRSMVVDSIFLQTTFNQPTVNDCLPESRRIYMGSSERCGSEIIVWLAVSLRYIIWNFEFWILNMVSDYFGWCWIWYMWYYSGNI